MSSLDNEKPVPRYRALVDKIIFQKDLSIEINSDLKQKNNLVVHTRGLIHWVVLTKINYGLEDKLLVLKSLINGTYLRLLRPAIIWFFAPHSKSTW